jgi:hypothetical protein
MPKDLVTLREVLLAPEQAILKKLQHRLDDPAVRAAELAKALPAAFALASTDPADLAAQLRPLVREALGDTLKERPDLLATGCRHALRHSFRNPFRTAGRTMSRLFRRRRRSNVLQPRLEQLYLVRRSDGLLLEHVERPPAAPEDPLEDDYQNDLRNMRSMATYLLATLRDPELLARYALLKTLRIERHLYGFHVDEKHLLLSVSLAGARVPADLLTHCDTLLAKASASDFTKLGTGALTPS